MNRTYDVSVLLDNGDGEWPADISYPFDGKHEEFFDWLESFATGPYLVLSKTIYFSYEQDRNFFLLAYNKEKFK